MKEDLAWAGSRPTSFHNAGGNAAESLTFENALNESETRFLKAYRERWPGFAYSLAQNGANSHAMHSGDRFLQTLIHNMHLVWHDVQSGTLAFLFFCFLRFFNLNL